MADQPTATPLLVAVNQYSRVRFEKSSLVKTDISL